MASSKCALARLMALRILEDCSRAALISCLLDLPKSILRERLFEFVNYVVLVLLPSYLPVRVLYVSIGHNLLRNSDATPNNLCTSQRKLFFALIYSVLNCKPDFRPSGLILYHRKSEGLSQLLLREFLREEGKRWPPLLRGH